MPFIYIHTPFRCNQKIRDNLRAHISRTLIGKCKGWELKEPYIHIAFTQEPKSRKRDKRAIMIRAKCFEHRYTHTNMQTIADLLKESVQTLFPREEIRCLFTVLSKETTAFSSTENDHRRY